MSYCVNCGVELNESEIKCPLCGTPVINPNQALGQDPHYVYPSRMDEPGKKMEQRWTILLLSITLALPSSVCLICDFITSHSFGWSLYVLGALCTLWVMIVPPYMLKRHRLLWSIALDTIAIGIFLFWINRMATPDKNWFVPLALPILALAGVLFFCLALLFQKVALTKLYRLAICFLALGMGLVMLEMLLDHYHHQQLTLTWSWMVLVPCAMLAVLYVVIERKIGLKQDLRRRLHR